MNWFYYKKIGLDIPGYWRETLKIILPLIPITFLGAGIHLAVPLAGWTGLILKGILYTVVFFVLGWIAIFNQYEKDLLGGLFRKLRRK